MRSLSFIIVTAGVIRAFALPPECIAQSSNDAAKLAPSIGRAVHLYTPPLWFESFGSAAVISPDAKRALNYAGGRVVDLSTGREVPQAIWTGLDRVGSAMFGPQGELLLQGRVSGQSGLYRQDADGRPMLIALPPGAGDPRWSTRWSNDGRQIAVILPGSRDSTIMAGELESLRPYPLASRPVALAWLPTRESLLVLIVDDSAMSSLVHVDLQTGHTRKVANDLDAGPRPLGFGVSPDGRHAYAALASAGKPSDAERNRPHAARAFGIYEIDLATGSRHVLVPPPTRGDFLAPTVARGQLYWTHTEADASTVVIPLTGGTVRTVIRDAQAPSWRPDGREIGVFYGDWRSADWAINWDGGAVDVDADGHPTSALIPRITGYGEDFPPIWSPDGRWIAYHSHRSPAPVPYYGAPGSSDDIWLRHAPTASRDPTEIRLTDFGWEVGSPDWSRDGTRLVFTSWERGRPGVSLPWIVTIDPATGRPLGHARLSLPEQIHGALWAAWSPVSDTIALEEDRGNGQHALWLVAADGSGARKLIEYPMLTDGGVCWTPDGRSIIYAAREGDQMQVFSIPSTGGVPRQLTHDSANIFQPRVSPDGRLIAATRLALRREILHRALSP
jgi:Tol biopolymer transport system component